MKLATALLTLPLAAQAAHELGYRVRQVVSDPLTSVPPDTPLTTTSGFTMPTTETSSPGSDPASGSITLPFFTPTLPTVTGTLTPTGTGSSSTSASAITSSSLPSESTTTTEGVNPTNTATASLSGGTGTPSASATGSGASGRSEGSMVALVVALGVGLGGWVGL